MKLKICVAALFTAMLVVSGYMTPCQAGKKQVNQRAMTAVGAAEQQQKLNEQRAIKKMQEAAKKSTTDKAKMKKMSNTLKQVR